MNYKTAISNTSPCSEQLLQGKKLINIDIEEVTTTDENDVETTSYTYTQLSVDENSNTEERIAKYREIIAQTYLDSTDYIDNKLINAVYVDKSLTSEEFIAQYQPIYTARDIARETVAYYEDTYKEF